MLRTLFVFAIVLAGLALSLQGPFYILQFYLWNSYFRPEQWMWVDYVSALRLPLLLGTSLVIALFAKVQDFRLSLRLVLIFAFAAQATLSMVLSEHYDWSLRFWIEFIKVIMICTAITVLVTDLQRYRITLLTIGYSLGFEAAKQGWAQLFLNPGATNNNPHPMLGDNNGMGFGMMMLIPLFVALTQTANSRWERHLHRFFIVGLLYRGISTYSRGAFLSAGVLGLLMFTRSGKKVRALVVTVALGAAVASVMPDAFWDRMNTITVDENQERESSSAGRLYFWEVATYMAEARPWQGVGFNAYRMAFPKYDRSGGGWGDDRAVHSAWFGVLSEMGYPGLVIFVSVIGTTLVACGRMRRRSLQLPPAQQAPMRAYATALQVSLVVYCVGVTFLNGQYNEMFWHFVALSIALEMILARALAAAAVTDETAEPPGEFVPTQVASWGTAR